MIGADRSAAAPTARITDPWPAGLPPVGTVDQITDSTDVLIRPAAARAVTAAAYGLS
ncbi:hypothetical protein [Catellatospora sp. NPDC049133]|uniref:hypothetical protein n=1 Tax=Catellatospora sp. NPDC049133 TaxID=3155499 RepID=UPI0034016DAF